MDKQSSNGLTGSYVQGHYDQFFADGEKDYTFDRWQRTPESKYHFAQSLRVFLRAIAPIHAKNALEIGGGDGLWTRIFAPHAERMTCVDISEGMLTQAQKKLADLPMSIGFLHKDFLENTFLDGQFDAVLAFRCFEYFPNKERALQELYRVLAPGGTLVLMTKSPQYDWRGYFSTKQLHAGIMEVRELRTAFQKQGFRVVDLYPGITGKGLSTRVGRWVGHGLQWFLIATRSWFPRILSRYVCESFLFVVQKPPLNV